MKKYEITYLTVNEEPHDASTISPLLQEQGAKIESVHLWGTRRRLTYPIKKQDQAFYTTVVFEAEPTAILPLETALRLNNDVLRSIVVLFEPGFFHREVRPEEGSTRDSDSKPKEKEAPAAKEAKPVEVAAPEAVTAATAEEPTEATPAVETEAKPKRTRAAKKPAEVDPNIDQKIDDLLKEDITA